MARNPADETLDERVIKAVMTFEHTTRKYSEDGMTLLSFTVRLPEVQGGEYLLIARVQNGTERLVCFRSGDFLAEVLAGFIRALQYGTLKLREDRYAD